MQTLYTTRRDHTRDGGIKDTKHILLYKECKFMQQYIIARNTRYEGMQVWHVNCGSMDRMLPERPGHKKQFHKNTIR